MKYEPDPQDVLARALLVQRHHDESAIARALAGRIARVQGAPALREMGIAWATSGPLSAPTIDHVDVEYRCEDRATGLQPDFSLRTWLVETEDQAPLGLGAFALEHLVSFVLSRGAELDHVLDAARREMLVSDARHDYQIGGYAGLAVPSVGGRVTFVHPVGVDAHPGIAFV